MRKSLGDTASVSTPETSSGSEPSYKPHDGDSEESGAYEEDDDIPEGDGHQETDD